MPTSLSFVSTLPLPSSSGRTNRPASTFLRSWRCTLAPRPQKFQPNISSSPRSSRQKCYRVLEPAALRPPVAPRHHSVPFIGLFIDILLGIQKLGFKPLFDRYDTPIFSSNYFLGDSFYVKPYSAIVDILKDSSIFLSADATPGFAELFGEDSIIRLDGHDHEVARSLIAPAFSSRLFPYYLKAVHKRVEATWETVFQRTKDGENVVKMDPIFREHYLSIIIEMTTGIGPARVVELQKLFSKIQRAFFSPTFGPIYNAAIKAKLEVVRILKEVIISNLENRADLILQLREHGGDNILKYGMKDIAASNIDVLLVSIVNSELSTDKEKYTTQNALIESLARTMMLLWFAGYVTAAVTSTGALFELGHRQEILSQLIAEQDACSPEELSYNDINARMPLLDSYLMEILRLFPAAFGLNRKSNVDLELLGRYVPGGSKIFVDIYSAQRDGSLYERPNELILERWISDDTTGLYPANGGKRPAPLLVFGGPGSPHYCIGAAFAKVAMKATFAILLRKYNFQLAENQRTEYRAIPDITPLDGALVKKISRRT